MSVGMLELARSLRDTLAAFDAEALPADACADVAEQLAATEKACAAARALAALRAAGCVHRRRGFASGGGDLGPGPAFDGVRCIEADCGRRHGLEWDHIDPVANGGPTSMQNLAPRCWPHHRD